MVRFLTSYKYNSPLAAGQSAPDPNWAGDIIKDLPTLAQLVELWEGAIPKVNPGRGGAGVKNVGSAHHSSAIARILLFRDLFKEGEPLFTGQRIMVGRAGGAFMFGLVPSATDEVISRKWFGNWESVVFLRFDVAVQYAKSLLIGGRQTWFPKDRFQKIAALPIIYEEVVAQSQRALGMPSLSAESQVSTTSLHSPVRPGLRPGAYVPPSLTRSPSRSPSRGGSPSRVQRSTTRSTSREVSPEPEPVMTFVVPKPKAPRVPIRLPPAVGLPVAVAMPQPQPQQPQIPPAVEESDWGAAFGAAAFLLLIAYMVSSSRPNY